jgi:beta-lactamase class A
MNYSLNGSKIPLNKVILACLLTGIFTYAISSRIPKRKIQSFENESISNNSSTKLKNTHLNNFRFIEPVLISDLTTPSVELNDLKNQLQQKNNQNKLVDSSYISSIYIKDLSNGEWTTINENEEFDPGSILKLPILIAVLRKADKDPDLLNKKIRYDGQYKNLPKQTIIESSIKKGEIYSIKELLRYMIVESDNEANMLLYNFLEQQPILEVFSDLGLNVPDPQQPIVRMNCIGVSKFLQVLYNATYTSHELSEFSLELLSQTKFKDGMYKGIPEGDYLVHKFGERGYPNTTFQELSETGIIYQNKDRYLVTIMTKGSDQKRQSESIKEYTAFICNWIKSNRSKS